LPADVINYGLTVKKSTTAPLMLIALYSPKEATTDLFSPITATLISVDPLTRVPGIGNVQIFGAGQYAMRPVGQARSAREARHHCAGHHHRSAKAEHGESRGQVGGEPIPSGQKFTYTVRAQGRLQTPEEFGEIVVRANRGRFVCAGERHRAH
jgi:HAE1 family hydrophobic/amphiphilic exporter-1